MASTYTSSFVHRSFTQGSGGRYRNAQGEARDGVCAIADAPVSFRSDSLEVFLVPL